MRENVTRTQQRCTNRQLFENSVYSVVKDSIQCDFAQGILMREILDAVFENGSFRPIRSAKVPLSQGQRVTLTIETPVRQPQDLIAMAAKVYDGLTDEQINDIERLGFDRSVRPRTVPSRERKALALRENCKD